MHRALDAHSRCKLPTLSDDERVENHTPSAPPSTPVHRDVSPEKRPDETASVDVDSKSAPPETPVRYRTTQQRSVGHTPSAPPKSPSISAGDSDFKTVFPADESRRIKRCKGALYGLRHLSRDIDTIIILDSNGRDVKGEDIDGLGDRVHVISIGGLCVAATTAALDEAQLLFPQIKRVVYSLGTNDRLHAEVHPGEMSVYLEALNSATKSVFPECEIRFILPFSGIKGMSSEYLSFLKFSVQAVGWKVSIPPSMKGKLVSPKLLHLKKPGRKQFISWLKQQFAPRRSTSSANPINSVVKEHVVRQRPAINDQRAPVPETSYATVTMNDRRAPVMGTSYTADQQRPHQYHGLASEIAAAISHVFNPAWGRDMLQHRSGVQQPPWNFAPY